MGKGEQNARGMAASTACDDACDGARDGARVPRAVALAFLAFALAVALVPSLGMLWAPTETTSENRELAALPALIGEDGSFNGSFLSDLGAYFDDHFAYRNEAVTANARLRALLGASATDQVVLGSDGWLYYGGTLPDYLGQSALSDRSLANVAHNLKLAQGYVESRGATFAFTLAPNKNSLDARAMPYYYLPAPDASNAERLAPALEREGVRYVDLFSLFKRSMEQDGAFRYLRTDSHWDNVWALMATNELLVALGRDGLPLDAGDAVERVDFRGDLESMLFPASDVLEANYYFAGYDDLPDNRGATWEYVEGSAVTDSWLQTRRVTVAPEADAVGAFDDGDEPEGEGAGRDASALTPEGSLGDAAPTPESSPGDPTSASASAAPVDGSMSDDEPGVGGDSAGKSLLMFRDSFGNALVPFWAGAFEKAAFSKLIPYNLGVISQVDADVVVIERAERHLSYLATSPPLMPSPSVTFANGLPAGAREVPAEVEVSLDGPYWMIRGEVAEGLSADARLYVGVRAPDGDVALYDPFWLSVASEDGEVVSDGGFSVLIPAAQADPSAADVRVYLLEAVG